MPSGFTGGRTRASSGAAPSEFFSVDFDFSGFYNLLEIENCTKLLRVDSTGTHVNGEGNYGFCSATCTAVSLFDLIGNLLGEMSDHLVSNVHFHNF